MIADRMLAASRVAMSKEPNGKWRLGQANRNASLWSGEEACSGEEARRVDDIGGLSTNRIGQVTASKLSPSFELLPAAKPAVSSNKTVLKASSSGRVARLHHRGPVRRAG